MSAAAPISELEIDDLFAPLAPYEVLILAVSGGADSVALMHLFARWAQNHPESRRRIVVATVDHGLRPGSRGEAEWVAEAAGALGLPHELLSWEGVKPVTGVQDAARTARYRLLAELAWKLAGAAPSAIVTAHTMDDQAETLLMRLARGSGIDGLTGMSASRGLGGEGHCRLERPLLAIAGARLKATLAAGGITWIEDPSNDCDRFERVRLRMAQPHLDALGLTHDKVALAAKRLDRARNALEAAADALQAAAGLDIHGGMFASLDAHIMHGAAEDVRLRVLARLISAFGGQDETARLAKLEALVERMQQPDFEGATLGGCIVARNAGDICVFREPGRGGLPELELAPGAFAVWDRRFRVGAVLKIATPVIVRALGPEGFARLRRHLKAGADIPPARAAATLPAFWQDGELLDVPSLAHLPGASATWGRESGLCSAEFLW